jgi:hypothetical protein
VADAILSAAVKPARDVKVGAGAKINTTVAKILPRLGDKVAARIGKKQHFDEPARNREGGLHDAAATGHTHGRGAATV